MEIILNSGNISIGNLPLPLPWEDYIFGSPSKSRAWCATKTHGHVEEKCHSSGVKLVEKTLSNDLPSWDSGNGCRVLWLRFIAVPKRDQHRTNMWSMKWYE